MRPLDQAVPQWRWRRRKEPHGQDEPPWKRILVAVLPVPELASRDDNVEHELNVAGAARDHEEVKELVSSEVAGLENRPVHQVDQGPNAVKGPAQGQPKQHPVREIPRQLSIAEQGTPPQCQIDECGFPDWQDTAEPNPRGAKSG